MRSTRQSPQRPIRTAKFGKPFVTTWILRAASQTRKFPEVMAAFASRVATSTTMEVAYWRKFKAPRTGLFCTNSFTVTTRRENRPATQCSMRPENWWAAKARVPLARPLHQNPARKIRDRELLLTSTFSGTPSVAHLVVQRPGSPLLACHSWQRALEKRT